MLPSSSFSQNLAPPRWGHFASEMPVLPLSPVLARPPAAANPQTNPRPARYDREPRSSFARNSRQRSPIRNFGRLLVIDDVLVHFVALVVVAAVIAAVLIALLLEWPK